MNAQSLPKTTRLPAQIATRQMESPERILLIQIGVLLVLSTWFFGSIHHWLPLVFALSGLMSPFIFAFFLSSSIDSGSNSWQRYLIHSLPAVVVIGMAVTGTINTSLSLISVGEEVFYARVETRGFMPSVPEPLHGLLPSIGFAGLYLTAINAMFLPTGRRFFVSLVCIIAINGALLALIGLTHEILGLERFLWVFEMPSSDFFGTFIYGPHFGAMAILLVGLLLGVAIYFRRRSPETPFLQSPIFLCSAISIALIAGALISSSPWELLILFTVLVVGVFHYAVIVFADQASPLAGRLGAGVLVFGAVALVVVSGIRLSQDVQASETGSEVRSANFFDLAEKQEVFHGSIQMVEQMPLFGWGNQAFPKVFPLFKSADLHGNTFATAQSDWLQMLVEFGVLGLLCLLIAPGIALLHYFRANSINVVSNYALIACLGLLLVSLLSAPFAHPGISALFWVLFFGAVGWGNLRRANLRVMPRENRQASNLKPISLGPRGSRAPLRRRR